MKFNKNIIIYTFCALIVVIIFILGQKNNIDRLNENLVSYDPHYHLAITNLSLDNHNLIKNVPTSVNSTSILYTSLLYPFVIVNSFFGIF